MTFGEKLKNAMQELGINQRQVCGLTGKSRASISQYLSGKQTPPDDVQSKIAIALGLAPDYFWESPTTQRVELHGEVIKRLLPEDAAKLMGMEKRTIRLGLQQGVFPWGYAIQTSENRWTYFINARRFSEIEGVVI
jgi:transcriptional regulator with XRE-family HTH domain